MSLVITSYQNDLCWAEMQFDASQAGRERHGRMHDFHFASLALSIK